MPKNGIFFEENLQNRQMLGTSPHLDLMTKEYAMTLPLLNIFV